MYSGLKRILVGPPLATTEEEHQRIAKTIALAVFSSDAISSTAYATEEILFVAASPRRVGCSALDTLVPIVDRGRRPAGDRRHVATARRSSPTRAVAAPTSSAARTSARCPSLVAGASLLVDYILTVAVSISAGVAAIIRPAFDGLGRYRVELVPRRSSSLITLANLRGIKESGPLFALPDLRLHRQPGRC